MTDPYEFIVLHTPALRRLCRSKCRGRFDLCDDLWSECVVERMPSIFKRYDGSLGASQLTHAYACLKWYMWKWMNRFERSGHGELRDVGRADKSLLNLDSKDEVQYLLRGLSEYDRLVITLYHIEGLTFKEIGEHLGVCKCTARNHYLRSLKNVRDARAND